MKKYLYIALAAAALTSCSSDETLDIQKEAIQFGNVFVGKSTRAAEDPSYSNATKQIQSFQLYGTVKDVNIYNNVTVENKTAAGADDDAGYGNIWYCPVTQYWVDGAAYKFAAVVDANSVTTDDKGMPTELSYTASGQKDMLYQLVTTTGKPTTNNGVVGFTFDHLLAKAKFTASNTTDHTNVQDGTVYTYDITDLKITNTYASATYKVASGWDVASAEPYETNFGSITGLTNGTPQECASEKLLIPGLTEISVSFNYIIKIGTTEIYKTTTPVTKTVAIPSNVTGGKITENNAYNFSFSLGLDDKIDFTVTAAPAWETPVNEVPVE